MTEKGQEEPKRKLTFWKTRIKNSDVTSGLGGEGKENVLSRESYCYCGERRKLDVGHGREDLERGVKKGSCPAVEGVLASR